jgi:hypothetical protein
MNPLHDEIRTELEAAAATLFDLADALADQQAESWADAGLSGRPKATALTSKLYALSAELEAFAGTVPS